MTLVRKYSKHNVPQQFVQLKCCSFRTSHGELDIKKIRAMSFLPSFECGKFKLQKAFQSGKILESTKKSNYCVTSILKLMKMMLKCQASVSLFYMHA